MRGMRPRRARDESMRRCGMAGRKYCGRTSTYRAGELYEAEHREPVNAARSSTARKTLLQSAAARQCLPALRLRTAPLRSAIAWCRKTVMLDADMSRCRCG